MAYIPDDMMRDVVMFTRAEVRRNFADMPFPACLDETGAQTVINRLRDFLDSGWKYKDLSDGDGEDAGYIRLLSGIPDDDLASSPLPHGIFARGEDADSDTVSVNGRDHIRLTVTAEGWQPEETFLSFTALDDLLAERYEIAFDDRLGYLTSAPGDVGTAFRMTSQLFLPALESGGKLVKVMPQLGRIGLSMRQTFGSGMAVYTLTTQITMGQSEKDSLKKLSDVTSQLCGLERAARAGLLSDDPDILKDRSERAEALIDSAFIVSSDEYKRLWKDLRTGVSYGFITGVDYSDIDFAANFCENDMLEIYAGELENDRARDKARVKSAGDVIFGAICEE